MAAIGVIFDDKRLLANLKAITRGVDDLTTPMRATGEYLTNQTRDRFDSQTAPNGAPWQPLSSNYQAHKRRNQERILTLDARLRRSIHYRAQRREVAVGTNLVYGAIHQLGFNGAVTVQSFTRRNKRNDVYASANGRRRKTASGVSFVRAHSRNMRMPARPYIGLSEQDYNEIPRIFTRWWETQLRRNGG